MTGTFSNIGDVARELQRLQKRIEDLERELRDARAENEQLRRQQK